MQQHQTGGITRNLILVILIALIVAASTRVSAQTAVNIIRTDSVAGTPLKQFAAEKTNNKIRLHWTIDTLNDLKTVVIEKSVQKPEFKQVAEFWMNTESIAISAFRYNDNAETNRITVYYRLKMIDSKGSVRYSDVITVQPEKNDTSTSGISSISIAEME